MKTKNAIQLRTAATVSAWSLIGLVVAALIVAAGSMVDGIPSWLTVSVGTGFFALWVVTTVQVAFDDYADALQNLEEM